MLPLTINKSVWSSLQHYVLLRHVMLHARRPSKMVVYSERRGITQPMQRASVMILACLISFACKDNPVKFIDNLHYKVAFTYSDSLGETLATVNQDGTNLRVVHRLPGTSFFLRWSPNGSKIAFDVYNVQLGVVNTDGTDYKLLANHSSSGLYGPWYSWFQDSERMAFSSNDTMSSVNITTGAQDPIGIGAHPMVSPSGDKIAYVRNSELLVMNPDGTAGTHLADSIEGGLAWSRDGGRIAFVKEGSTLCTVEQSGIGLLQLTPRGTAIPRMVSWSPSGNKIAFEWVYGIQIASSNGSGVATLAVNASMPSWHPDGSFIAYIASGGILVLKRPDGSDSARVVPLRVSFSAAWSPISLP